MIWIRESSGSSAQIDPSCGGTVRRICRPEELLYDPETVHEYGCDTELFSGRILLPFADRIAGGHYHWHGSDYTLPLNDHEMGDAIHGFLYRQAMRVEEQRADSVTLQCYLEGQSGYPWPLEVTVTYRVASGMFLVRVEAVNRGSTSAPLTMGWHPYFDFDRSASLQIDASRYIEADDELRLTGRRPFVQDTPFDFRRSRTIGADDVDVALELDGAGNDTVVLTDSTRSLTLTPAGVFARIQVFTPPGGRGIALEPVSAPGEAFNIPALGVTELAPGASAVGSVVIRHGPGSPVVGSARW